MKSIFGGKVPVIILGAAAILILVFLASGLEQVKFTAPFLVKTDNIYALNTTGDVDNPAPAWSRYVVIAAILIIILLSLGPIRPRTGSDLVKRVLFFSVATFLFMIVMGRFANTNPFLTGDFAEPTGSGATTATTQTPSPFTMPEATTDRVFWITAIIVVVVSIIVVVLFNRLMDKWSQPKQFEELADIARLTLQELSAEKLPRNAIIRCYTRMTAAVNETRGLSRNESMTPGEFASHLQRAGLPGEDVQGLTHIFEKVRYGAQDVEAEEIKQAKKYLNGILKACEAKP